MYFTKGGYFDLVMVAVIDERPIKIAEVIRAMD
jgi:hypothetical protein